MAITIPNYNIAEKFDALAEAFTWASKTRTTFASKEPHRKKEANRILGLIEPGRQSIIDVERKDIDLEAGTGKTLDWPRQEVIYTTKEFAFNLKFSSRDGRHTAEAWTAANNVQQRINASVVDRRWLRAYGWGLTDIGDVIPIAGGTVFDRRIEGLVVLELLFNTCLIDRDSANVSSYFERLKIKVRLKKPGDQYLDPKLDIDEEF